MEDEHDRPGGELLAYQLSEMRTAMVEQSSAFRELIRQIDVTHREFDRRLVAVETWQVAAEKAGEAAEKAAEKAVAAVLQSEDRFGRWSPRAIAATVACAFLGTGGVGAAAAIALTKLL